MTARSGGWRRVLVLAIVGAGFLPAPPVQAAPAPDRVTKSDLPTLRTVAVHYPAYRGGTREFPYAGGGRADVLRRDCQDYERSGVAVRDSLQAFYGLSGGRSADDESIAAPDVTVFLYPSRPDAATVLREVRRSTQRCWGKHPYEFDDEYWAVYRTLATPRIGANRFGFRELEHDPNGGDYRYSHLWVRKGRMLLHVEVELANRTQPRAKTLFALARSAVRVARAG